MGDRAETFAAVVDGISSDGFLFFVDRFLRTDAGQLDWAAHDGAFTLSHLQAHARYCSFYESRVRSTLVRHGLTEEAFAEECRRVLETREHPSEGSSGAPKEADAPATLQDYAEALVEMLSFVSSFEAFAGMMAQRQQSVEED